MSKNHVLLLVGAFALSFSFVAMAADDGAAGAAAEAVKADAQAVETKAEAVEQGVKEEKKSGSWWSWLWPFGSDDDDAVAEKEEAGAKAVAGEKAEAPAEEVVEEVKEVPEPVVAEEGDEGGEDNSFAHAALMYFPNLFMDLGDIFSLSLGVGAESGVEVRLTRWCQLGGMYGNDYFVEKAYNRTYGGGYNDGYDFQLFPLASEVRSIDPVFGGTSICIIKDNKARVLSPDDKLYKENIRDFWAVGAKVGWLILVSFDIHPVQIADFFTGIVAYDLCDDNM